jgi:hypothetical protein
MALHELQIAEVDIENAARPHLLVDQLNDSAFVNSCSHRNGTLRSRGVLSYRIHQAYEIDRRARSVAFMALIHPPHRCADGPRGSCRFTA